MKERFFWISATVILLLAVVILLLLVGNSRRKLNTVQQEHKAFVTEIDSLKIYLEHFRKERNSLELFSHEKLIGFTRKGSKIQAPK